MRRSHAALWGAAIVLAGSVAWADGGDPVAARAQLRQGYALKQQGKCKEAVPFLQESARLDRQPKTLLNLGDCEQSLGQLAAAQAHFLEARDLARQQGIDALKNIGEKRLQDIEKRMPKLAIDVAKDAPPDTVVTRDGVEVGKVSLHTPLPIDVGRHVIVARGGGFERQFELALAESETKNIEVTPIGGKAIPKPVVAAADKPSAGQSPSSKKETSRAPGAAFKIDGPTTDRAESGSSAQRTLGFITLGVGALGLGGGAYFGARMLSKKTEASTMCTDLTPCSSEGAAAFEKTKSDARSARTNAFIGFGVGGAAALTGVILLLTAPKAMATGWRVAPAMGQSTVGAVVDGTF
ncbi:MAG TPA: tetratricopeptide repeat protein [Polyangiaceae bacterium]|nr:tetratricopeptide repeat protein [Polyangiaceae bacterium]